MLYAFLKSCSILAIFKFLSHVSPSRSLSIFRCSGIVSSYPLWATRHQSQQHFRLSFHFAGRFFWSLSCCFLSTCSSLWSLFGCPTFVSHFFSFSASDKITRASLLPSFLNHFPGVLSTYSSRIILKNEIPQVATSLLHRQ